MAALVWFLDYRAGPL